MLKSRFSPVTFSPFDMRCYLRLALIVLAWKHASQDYSALAILGNRPPVFLHSIEAIQRISVFINAHILVSEMSVTALQLVGIAACVFAFIRPSRHSLILAFAAVSVIEFPAFLWRYQNWDFDLPLAVILMAIVCPVNLSKATSPDPIPTPESNILGWMLATYMATMYFFAGLSKLVFDPNWISHVTVGNNWRTQFLDITEYGKISALFGEQASHLLLAVPIVGVAISLVILVDQLLMPLALFDRRFRTFGPALVFANHLGIAVAIGVFFSSMPFLGTGIFFPWSAVFKKAKKCHLIGMEPQRLKFFGCIAVAFLLVAIPGITHRVYHPFADNFIFGWRYNDPSEYKSVKAIGYRSDDGTFKPLPRGHGGFIESRLNTTIEANAVAESLKEHPDVERNPNITTLLCAWRQTASNAWLLGPLALPEHRWSKMRDLDLDRELYLLEGRPEVADIADKYKVVRVDWSPIVAFKRQPCQ